MGEHRQGDNSRRCAARCRARRCPSRARAWDTHTARSPLLLVLASHVPNACLNSPADLLAVASVTSSVAVDIERGRVDAPFDVRPTLATCTCLGGGRCSGGTLRLRVACACQTRVWARPCAQRSSSYARRAAWHRRLSGRPRSRAQACALTWLSRVLLRASQDRSHDVVRVWPRSQRLWISRARDSHGQVRFVAAGCPREERGRAVRAMCTRVAVGSTKRHGTSGSISRMYLRAWR